MGTRPLRRVRLRAVTAWAVASLVALGVAAPARAGFVPPNDNLANASDLGSDPFAGATNTDIGATAEVGELAHAVGRD